MPLMSYKKRILIRPHIRLRCQRIMLALTLSLSAFGLLQLVLIGHYRSFCQSINLSTGPSIVAGISKPAPLVKTAKPAVRANRRARKTKPDLRDLLGDNLPHMNDSAILIKQQISSMEINKLLDDENDRKMRLELCPCEPPHLRGVLNVTDAKRVNTSHVSFGGASSPVNCRARHHVAVIIPYRDRKEHLNRLLNHLHPILQRQQLNYRVFVVEQKGTEKFNKGRLMNIAFAAALNRSNFECFIFHDVDLLLEDDRNLHSCPPQPRHMSVAIDKFNYTIPYSDLVGGVFAIRTEHFLRVNGYSNVYWGWGAEDDDMAFRIAKVNLQIIRPPTQIARYVMIKHEQRKPLDGKLRYPLLWSGTRRFHKDGLSTLPRLPYAIVSNKEHRLYTHIMVDVGEPPPGF